MDSISDKQQKILSLGGNKRFFNFMQAYSLNSQASNTKYRSKAAEYYRARLKAEAEGDEYSASPPEEKEGKEMINEELACKKTVINTQQYGNGIKKKGLFDKMLDAAKDFGEITKNAAENVWNTSFKVSFLLRL
eukprot:TRINITY_DN3451_c0_g1_i2.p2 TRINITY_DN3451_c0_g1~~TRINITY_DN3451_c0_g1_i2.p2  ORF type:complete len:134 (+),score=45.25 TRINITY_DN3451_c0_g1_i2:348-749(+)